jgi:phosphoribosylanthranilate isomerase
MTRVQHQPPAPPQPPQPPNDEEPLKPHAPVPVDVPQSHAPASAPQPEPQTASTHRVALRRTRIKICGITSVDMALVAADAGADAIGLVFVPQSPRYVLPGPAQRIAKALPPLLSAVGVFLNPSDPDLANWRGSWVQMHGNEEEPQLARVAQNRRIIKGLRFDRAQVRRWEKCPHVTGLLIDGSEGGDGKTFNHELLAEILPSLSTPVILAGGLSPQNVGEAIRLLRPFGVDVSSGVESSRGVKDAGLIREFCAAVREADAKG